jgi:hypothetical protein
MEDTSIENYANAKLIASTPKMLKALNLFLQVIDRSPVALEHYGEAIKLGEETILELGNNE